MGKKYSQLDQSMRDRIKVLVDDGCSARQVGQTLGIHHTTVSREIKRNSYGCDGRTESPKHGTYDSSAAQQKAYVRRKYARYQGKKIQEDNELRSFIIQKLERHWNPDEIAGYLKRNPHHGFYASKTALYEWLRSEWGQRYCEHLYSKRKRVKRRKPKKTKRVLIPERTSIDQRPVEVTNRSRYGDWEQDAVVSSKRSGSSAALSVIQERRSRYVYAGLTSNMKPDKHTAVTKQLTDEAKVLSITYDNGIENRNHTDLKERGIATFFTDPYSSWQKGSVENANKMLRRYFPKGTDFSTISQTDVVEALTRINNKPRKILGYKSSLQVAKEKGVLVNASGALRG
jgi:IS30 family transposase